MKPPRGDLQQPFAAVLYKRQVKICTYNPGYRCVMKKGAEVKSARKIRVLLHN